jgi:protein-tyrosine-phosphatase
VKKRRVLIVCTGNSARSQMAEGLIRYEAGDQFEVFSAGTQPTQVRPEAVAVMRALGIDIPVINPSRCRSLTGRRSIS